MTTNLKMITENYGIKKQTILVPMNVMKDWLHGALRIGKGFGKMENYDSYDAYFDEKENAFVFEFNYKQKVDKRDDIVEVDQ